MLYMMYLYSLSFVSWQLTHAKTVKFLACILKVNIFATLAKGTFCLTLIQDAFYHLLSHQKCITFGVLCLKSPDHFQEVVLTQKHVCPFPFELLM